MNTASERLTRLNSIIMHTWEVRAMEEVEASIHQTSLALRDSLPEFLGQIAHALSTIVDRTPARVRWDRQESERVGKKHGKERAGFLNYTMDQLIFEYHILRQVICEVMEDEEPLSFTEREIIVCAVEQAVNDAATEFSDTLTSIQEKFTHTLIHDLRSPITATKLGIHILLRKPEDTDNVIKVAGRVNASMDRLDNMIHDLLDASRLRAGQGLNIPLEDCDLNTILRDVTDEYNFQNGNRIKLNAQGQRVGRWNEKYLMRIFDNLLSNAIKFSTPDTLIHIESKIEDKKVIVKVNNRGEPIPADELPTLFTQFKRRSNEDKPGWGLGLTVVKGIANAFGGTADVESSKKAGTTFVISLPL